MTTGSNETITVAIEDYFEDPVVILGPKNQADGDIRVRAVSRTSISWQWQAWPGAMITANTNPYTPTDPIETSYMVKY